MCYQFHEFGAVQRGEDVRSMDATRTNRGVQREVIDRINVFTFSREEGGAEEEDEDSTRSCCICLEAFDEGDQLRMLPCLHDFHTGCIDPWLKQNCTCPLCKEDVEMLLARRMSMQSTIGRSMDNPDSNANSTGMGSRAIVLDMLQDELDAHG
jgi:hypothetical protein